jgi:DNA-binding NtrC family response regulator
LGDFGKIFGLSLGLPIAPSKDEFTMAEMRLPENLSGKGPVLIIAHEDADYASVVGRQFRQLGWQIQLADSVSEVRRLSRQAGQAVLILSAEFPGESGWLTCAKLMQERPFLKVVLVVDHRTADGCRFAAFVGSVALVEKSAGVRGLIDHVYRVTDLPATG